MAIKSVAKKNPQSAKKRKLDFSQIAIVAEKGFSWEEGEVLKTQKIITEQIGMMGWGEFALQPKPGYELLVKDFLSKIDEKKPEMVRVRGKDVVVSDVAINEIYKVEFETDYFELHMEKRMTQHSGMLC